MATYDNPLGMPRVEFNDPDWHLTWQAQTDNLTGQAALAGLAVVLPAGQRPTSGNLDVTVNAGAFLSADRAENVHAGGTLTLPDNSESYIWLDDAGVLTQGTAGYPAAGTAHVPLARVTTAAGTVTQIVDDRVTLQSGGRSLDLDYLPRAAADSAGVVTVDAGTTNGVQLGTGATQKLGFFGATPAVRPTVTGSRSDGTALQSLLTALAALGLVTDSTTA